ncbi:MAG: GCN5-related N-acetyltransferase [Gemmatimonadetes bacterium]|nr:GCN5-related N-acetyltransferase [Gemmatimonadota bacterium]
MTSRATSSITTRRATTADAALLAELAATAFSDSFAADNSAENMALYMDSAFGEATQRDELSDPTRTVFFAEQDGVAVGYTMLHDAPVPPSVGDDTALEIARLYSAKRMIGTGVGATLMQRCIDEATARGRQTLWLGVWESNARAIAFYQRWGFVPVGSQTFTLGHDVQSDLVMARRASEAK